MHQQKSPMAKLKKIKSNKHILLKQTTSPLKSFKQNNFVFTQFTHTSKTQKKKKEKKEKKNP